MAEPTPAPAQPVVEADEREALARLREHVEMYGNTDMPDEYLLTVPLGALRTILARRSQPAPRTVTTEERQTVAGLIYVNVPSCSSVYANRATDAVLRLLGITVVDR